MIKFNGNNQEDLDQMLDSYLLGSSDEHFEVETSSFSYIDSRTLDAIDDYIINGYN